MAAFVRFAPRLAKPRGMSRRKQAGFINLGIRRLLFGGSAKFSPQDMFKNGEAGAHFEAYDPSALLLRRNLLTYSNFGGATAGTPGTAPTNWVLNFSGGSTAIAGDVVTLSTAGAARHFYASPSITLIAGETATIGFEITAVSVAGTPETVAAINYSVGTATGTSGWTSALGPGRITTTITAGVSGVTFQLRLGPGCSTTTVGATSLSFKEPQIEKGSAATAYQRVTDWNAEYMTAALESIGMWQDAVGTPVTAVEQAVGVLIDLKQSRSFGPNVWSNSVAVGTGATIAVQGDGSINITATSASFPGVRINGQFPSGSFVSGEVYRVEVQWSANNQLRPFSFNVGGASAAINSNVAGSRAFYCVPTASTQGVTFFLGTGAQIGDTFTVTVVSVKKVSGNHASQATAGSRPFLKALYNRAIKTEQIDDATFTKTDTTVTANATTAPDGNVTADLLTEGSAGTAQTAVADTIVAGSAQVVSVSLKRGNTDWVRIMYASDGLANGLQVWANLNTGALGTLGVRGTGTATSASIAAQANGFYRITLRGMVAAASTTPSLAVLSASADNTGTRVSGATYYVWGVDFRTADDAAKNIPAYQRVNTATDYDTAGFPFYLKFDGIDDSLTTPSIAYGGATCLTLWAGTTKLSDAAAAVLFESSASSSTNNGTYALLAPNSASTDFLMRSHNSGTAPGNAVSSGAQAAPKSAIVRGTSNAGLPVEISLNGGAPLQGGTAVGAIADNIGNIGRRGGSTLPLNGRLTSLTLRGTTTPTSDAFITKMNNYAKNLAALAY